MMTPSFPSIFELLVALMLYTAIVIGLAFGVTALMGWLGLSLWWLLVPVAAVTLVLIGVGLAQ